MITRLMGQDATIVRYGETGRDRLNRPTRTVQSRVSTRCRLEQTGTAESDTYVIDSWRGYFPFRADIRAGDDVEESGRRFRVEGTPAVQVVPGVPAANHLLVALKYVGEVE